MFEILKEEGKAISVRAYGNVTIKDYAFVYKELIPKFDKLISEYGRVNFLVDMQDLDSMSPEAWLEEFKIGFKYRNDCGRLAFIGRKAWMDELLGIIIHIITCKTRFFEPDETDKAWDWVRAS